MANVPLCAHRFECQLPKQSSPQQLQQQQVQLQHQHQQAVQQQEEEKARNA